MNLDVVTQFSFRASFREAVWLFPVAFTLHVLEELPRWNKHTRLGTFN
jgi:hypothetical protein